MAENSTHCTRSDSSNDSFYSFNIDQLAENVAPHAPRPYSSQPSRQRPPYHQRWKSTSYSMEINNSQILDCAPQPSINRCKNLRKLDSIGKFAFLKLDVVENLKTADLEYAKRLYVRLRKSYVIANKNIFFNKICRKEGLEPNYASLRTNNSSSSARKSVIAGKKRWVKFELQRWYSTRDSLSMYILVLHHRINQLIFSKIHSNCFNCYQLACHEFDEFDRDARDQVKLVALEKQECIDKKLEKLREIKANNQILRNDYSHSTSQSAIIFPERVINLSSTIFTENEKSVLDKGLKHSFSPDPTSHYYIKNTGISIESSLNRQDPVLANITNAICANTLKNELDMNRKRHFDPEIKLLSSIKSKLKRNDLILTKADKGNAVVIMDQAEYHDKMLIYIRDNKLTVLQKDPTNEFDWKVRDFLRASTIFSNFEKKIIVEMNPHPPLLYGLPKIHKNPLKMRPVVSYIGTSVHQLAQKASKLFHMYTSFKAERSIQNTQELVDKIKIVDVPPSAKLVSFDVVQLFNRIPPREVQTIAENIILKSKFENTKKLELITMIEICLSHNFLQYKNTIYSDPNGLPIGSPLSPLMAELFLDHLETKIFDNPHASQIVYWYRYVDDVIALFTGTTRQLEIFKNFINSLHPKIEFELETAQNESLNFLDLTITIVNGKHTFSIYRKPTHTDTTIHMNSCRPFSHKLAAFHSMIHRLLTTPLDNDAHFSELQTIKEIAIKNGYTESLIDKLIDKKKKAILTTHIFPNPPPSPLTTQVQPKPRVFLPYYGNFSERIAKELRKLDYQVIFRASNTLGRQLSKTKDPVMPINKSGVYQLNCGNPTCSANYIGQTGRSFQKRFSEHFAAIRLSKQDYNSFTDHIIQSQHPFDPNTNTQLLHFQQKGRLLDGWENYEILKSYNQNPDTCMNEHGKIYRSPILEVLKIV